VGGGDQKKKELDEGQIRVYFHKESGAERGIKDRGRWVESKTAPFGKGVHLFGKKSRGREGGAN